MDERQFDIQVDGTTREEFREASREMVYDVVPTGLLMVTILTFCILLLMKEITLWAILLPYLIMAVAFVAGIVYMGAQWKKFPSDMQYSYLIDAEGWQLTIGENFGGSNWDETRKMKDRKHVLLFYQRESNAASSLPKRCLSEEQLAAIRGWYRDSRKAYKAKDKELFEKERQAKKANRSRRRW